MPEHATRQDDQHQRQLIHDVRHCLYVIGLGTEMLKSARTDENRFAELCESIDKERLTACKLFDELVAAGIAGDGAVK